MVTLHLKGLHKFHNFIISRFFYIQSQVYTCKTKEPRMSITILFLYMIYMYNNDFYFWGGGILYYVLLYLEEERADTDEDQLKIGFTFE